MRCRPGRSVFHSAADHHVERALEHLVLLDGRGVHVRRRRHRAGRQREHHLDELARVVRGGRRDLIDAAVGHLHAVAGLGHRSPSSTIARKPSTGRPCRARTRGDEVGSAACTSTPSPPATCASSTSSSSPAPARGASSTCSCPASGLSRCRSTAGRSSTRGALLLVDTGETASVRNVPFARFEVDARAGAAAGVRRAPACRSTTSRRSCSRTTTAITSTGSCTCARPCASAPSELQLPRRRVPARHAAHPAPAASARLRAGAARARRRAVRRVRAQPQRCSADGRIVAVATPGHTPGTSR